MATGGHDMMERSGDNWFDISKIDPGNPKLNSKFWQAQGPKAKFAAVLVRVVLTHIIKEGDPAELEPPRNVETVRDL